MYYINNVLLIMYYYVIMYYYYVGNNVLRGSATDFLNIDHYGDRRLLD